MTLPKFFRTTFLNPIWIIGFLLSAHLGTGCVPIVLDPGSIAEASTAHSDTTTGKALRSAVETEILTILNTLSVDPSIASILLPKGVGSQAIVLESAVLNAYGSYVENATGTFDFTPNTTAEIQIQFLTGTNTTITSFQFEESVMYPGDKVLASFFLTSTPLNPSATDAEPNISFAATRQNYDFVGDSSAVDEWASLLKSSHVLYDGDIHYLRGSNKTKYKYSTTGTAVGYAPKNASLLRRVNKTVLKDITISEVTPAFVLDNTDSILFQSTDTTGVLAAQLLTSRFIYVRTYTSTSTTVDQKISIILADNPPNTAKYKIGPADNRIRGIFGVIPFLGNFDNYSISIWNSHWVAKPTGGSVDCNLLSPTSVGAGTPMEMRWSNDATDRVMPNPGQLTCADLIIQQPSATPLL